MNVLVFFLLAAGGVFLLLCPWFYRYKTKQTDKNFFYWTTESNLRRFGVLFFNTLFGLLLAHFLNRYCVFEMLFSSSPNNCSFNDRTNIYNSLLGVVIGLPVFVGLWFFRTVDTREQLEATQEQIKKTQDQIDRQALNFEREALFSENPSRMWLGFTQLLALREKDLFVADIENILKSKRAGTIDLSGFDLTDKNLEGFYLGGVNLTNAKLIKANLQEAQFNSQTYLERADFTEADLRRTTGLNQVRNINTATLHKAKLQDLDLRRANLQGAKLTEADLEGADLQGANLGGANLGGANLQGAKVKRELNQGGRISGTKGHHSGEIDWQD